ncbi:hypothetical protein NDI52_33680 [Leptolyngbya sp. PL-A3]|uniref:hypothetical protein n=1 Tax=Leptolyngbya sp. PL-A3 TaxID=2933911 RepID=UPI00329824F9
MSLANVDRFVTPPKNSGGGSKNAKYRTRWIKQAQYALAKSKRGGYPDRRERRLIARFQQWQAEQRQQQQQSNPEQQKAA